MFNQIRVTEHSTCSSVAQQGESAHGGKITLYWLRPVRGRL